MNIVVWLEFEHAYYDVTVQHISHYATDPHPPSKYSIILFSTQNYI